MDALMTFVWKKVALRLKAERIARGLTQPEIAARLGVGHSYIGKIERGEQIPPSDTLMAFITDGLQMSPATFFMPWLEPENDLERYAKRILTAALRDSRRDLALDLLETLKRGGQAPRVK